MHGTVTVVCVGSYCGLWVQLLWFVGAVVVVCGLMLQRSVLVGGCTC